MEEERIVWSGILDEPVHGPENICFCRLAHGILLVVGQNDHVLALVTEISVQVCGHVLHIVDATPQLTALSKVVDTDEKGFSPTVASRVLERVARGRAMTEILGSSGRWRGRVVVAMCPLIAIHGGHLTWTR